MALDIQTFNLTASYLPFERPPDPIALWSAIPRGILTFSVEVGAVNAKPINDELFVKMNATLPPNYAYILQDINILLSGDTASDWSSFMSLNLQNFYRGPEDMAVALSSSWRQDFLINDPITSTTRCISRSVPWPSMPIVGVRGTSGVLTSMTIANAAAPAGAAAILNVYAAYWQYDLEQIRKYPINTPLPVVSR